MRDSLCLALLASLLIPRPSLADCSSTNENGVVTILPCPSKIVIPKDDPPPKPDLTVTGTPDVMTVVGGILKTTYPKAAPKPPDQASPDKLSDQTPTDIPNSGAGSSQQFQQPGSNGGASAPGGRTGPASVAPAAAAKSGAAQERQALGSTGATANGLSVSAGDKFLLANQPADAERNYQRALDADPNDTAALTGHVQALGALGRKDEALSAARRLLSLDPSNPVAKSAIAEQRAEGATSKFKKMTDSFLHGAEGENLPDRPAGGERAGPGADQAASRPRADAGGVPVAVAGPRGGDGGLTFGPLLLQAQRKQAVGDYTGALIDVSQAIDANPKDAAAWTLRAELDLQLSNFPAGVSDSTRALDLGADNPRALRARAYGEYETRLYKQALADATRAVQLDPKSGLGYLYKAMAEEKLGLADAESDLRLALALDPTLKRLAGPLLAKYNVDAGAAPERRLKPWMVRAGFVGAAMTLVMIGLLGTQKARTLKAIKLTPRRARADDEPITSGDLAPGRMLGGGYRIARELGRGGMGVVYEAFDERLRRTVAIKRLLRDELTTPDDTALFLREARIVAQLKHPNLAQIYDVADEREPFLVFEYVDGEPLDRVLTRAVVLTPGAARPIVAQISAALTYAHGRGVVHRDLKPSNVMVTAAGAVKVMDFGIAHQSRGSATRLTQTVASGTPPYMAPEQAMGSVSKASDLYALGVMTYELLTGKRPFEGPDFLGPKLEKRFTPASKANPALAAALDQFFASALDPDPTRRPADAAAFMAAFGRACDATPRHPSAA